MQRISFLIILMAMMIPVYAETIPLSQKSFIHIRFKKIPATRYRFDPDGITIHVNRSASGLLYSFNKPVQINRIRILWKRTGNLNIKSVRQEASKDGDDSFLRIGLLIEGKPRGIPFFAPDWIKQVSSHLKTGFDRVIYLFVDARHPPGSHWISPYSRDIENRSIAGQTTKNGYQHVDHRLSNPVSVTGIILMSDGDNTRSEFTIKLKQLEYN